MTKCDMCLCAVCNAYKCPYKPLYIKDLQISQLNVLACAKRCYSLNKKQPCLQCDFFIHKKRIRVFRIKRKEKNFYTVKEVAEMLQRILDNKKGE